MQSITPTPEDVAVLREPFVNKGANDPVVLEVKRILNDATPDWLRKLNESAELTTDRLNEIRSAADAYRALVEAVLPAESLVRAEQIDKLNAVIDVVEDMTKEMVGAGAFSGISA